MIPHLPSTKGLSSTKSCIILSLYHHIDPIDFNVLRKIQ